MVPALPERIDIDLDHSECLNMTIRVENSFFAHHFLTIRH